MPLLSGRIDVALDPGHSSSDPGATGAGVDEHELTLPLARKVRDRLAARGVAVVLTRTDAKPLTAYTNPDPTTRVRLEQEARIAAGAGARIYVSLHFNGHADTRMRGSSVYYNPSNHGARSHRLATLLQASIVSHARDRLGYQVVDIGVLDDQSAGKPYGHFFSLRGPFPSALVEAMYPTNAEEARLLTRDETLDVLADAYAEGIHAYLAEVDALFQRPR